MRYFVLPYRQGSRGARALATALSGRVLRLTGSTYQPRPSDVIVNWGNTDHWEVFSLCTPGQQGLLNPPANIKNASNKLLFFRNMKEACPDIIPEFWENKDDIPDTAFPVVCRTVLAGHSGDGIVISPDRDSVVPASLYVKYVKKQDEYRIHVGMKTSYEPTGHCEGTVIISVQRKARRLETPDEQVNWQVRNHQNGFVYVRQGVSPPAAVIAVAQQALEASGLDFGAVDVLWNSEKGKAYVLEINTAPGLEGTTVEDYAKFFKGV